MQTDEEAVVDWTPQQYSKTRYGEMRPSPPTKGRGKAFLWLSEHVTYQGDNCLPWPYAKDRRVGRGSLGYKGKIYWAHRLMCEMAHGAPPTRKHQAAHTCGKGHYGCVNPRHLEWKTNSANQLDRAKNGNALRNRNGNRPSLTKGQLAEIVSLKGKMSQVAIAAKFGVSLGCIQYWFKYRVERGHTEGKIRHWLPEQEQVLVRGITAGWSLERIATHLGRSYGAVRTKAIRLGFSEA